MLVQALFPEISGTWTGFYELPLPETRPRAMPPRVPFTIRLVESPRGTVRGEIQDESPIGFPEAGTVSGGARLFSVALEIERPVFRLRQADGLITLEEWVRERYPAVQEINAVPHPTTYVTARLLRWNGSMAGTWWVPGGSLVDQTSGWHATYPSRAGVWQAHRIARAGLEGTEAEHHGGRE